LNLLIQDTVWILDKQGFRKNPILAILAFDDKCKKNLKFKQTIRNR